jgi:hypothetical protein
MSSSKKACPFVSRECLQENCLAWRRGDCSLSPASARGLGPFERKLMEAAPLMYRTLLDLVKVMEESSRDCGTCGPELWNYAQQVRASFLDELIAAELAIAGIKQEEGES